VEGVDFDVDPGREMSERGGDGPTDAGRRQERLVEGEDFCPLQRIGMMVHPALVEAVVDQGIEDVSLDEEVLQRIGPDRMDRPGRDGPDQVGGGSWFGAATNARVEDRLGMLGGRRSFAFEEHPRMIIRKVVEAPGQ
jgi:hypothetical protein